MDKAINLDDLLINFHESSEKVYAINKKLTVQITEISKTKLLLDKCHNCLSLQNDMLNKLEIEKQKVLVNNNELVKCSDRSVTFVKDKYSISNCLDVKEKSDSTKKQLLNDLMLPSETNSNSVIEVTKSGKTNKIISQTVPTNKMSCKNKEKQIGEKSVTSTVESQRSQVERIGSIEIKLPNCSSFETAPVKTTLGVFEFHKSVYESIERMMMLKFTSQKILKFKYENQTQIPNEMKFPNPSKRKMFLAVLEKETIYNITDIFGEINCTGASDNLLIHIINKDMDISFEEIDEQLFLKSEFSLQIENLNGWKSKIKISPRSVPAIVVLEVIIPEPPLAIPKQPIDSWTYYDGEEDEISRMSFIRYPMSNLTEELRFIATSSVGLKHEIAHLGMMEKALCLVTIVNYAGKIIINTIVTPRLPVKHYNNHEHGLGSLQFVNQMDEYDCIREVRKLLDKKIIVGYNVLESLALLKMPLERILGIRDISNAICFYKMRFLKRRGYYGFSYLKKELLPPPTYKSSDLKTLLDATAIRLIYQAIEDKWEDNKYPNTRNMSGSRQKFIEIENGSFDYTYKESQSTYSSLEQPQNEGNRETKENSDSKASEVIIVSGMQPRQGEEFLKIKGLENYRLQSATYKDPSGKKVQVAFRD